MSSHVDALFDDPDFFGVVFQHYHVSGDERLPHGSPSVMPRHAGQDLIERTLNRGDGSDPSFEAWPVYRQRRHAAPSAPAAGSLLDRIRPDVEAAPWVCEEIGRLEKQRAELLDALEALLPEAGKNFSDSYTWARHEKARAAIAKARGAA